MERLVRVVMFLRQAEQFPVQRHVLAHIVLYDPAFLGLLNLEDFLLMGEILV